MTYNFIALVGRRANPPGGEWLPLPMDVSNVVDRAKPTLKNIYFFLYVNQIILLLTLPSHKAINYNFVME